MRKSTVVSSITWDVIVALCVYGYATDKSVVALVIGYGMAFAAMVLSNLNLIVVKKKTIQVAILMNGLKKSEIAFRRMSATIDIVIACAMALSGLVFMSGMYTYALLMSYVVSLEVKRTTKALSEKGLL